MIHSAIVNMPGPWRREDNLLKTPGTAYAENVPKTSIDKAARSLEYCDLGPLHRLPEPAVPAHRIVAIDYDAQIGERLRVAFAPPEFEFHWFAGGIEALAALQGLQPDVIICDVMLPDIDGRAVLDAVKRSPALRDVPLLVLSGVRSEATMRATLDAGADAFLLKPFPVSQLVQTIRKVLRDVQTDASTPSGEVQRSPATSPGLSAVGRTGRDAA